MHEVAPINPWVALAYLASGILFILALRGLSSPASSRRGNRYGMIGMTIAVVTTLITHAPWKSGDAANGYVGIDAVAMAEILGAIAIGMTNTPEFSMRAMTDNPLHGLTLNPWDRAITCGGSSGGAASAVALGIGAIAHGNDIGGSLRWPAFACGVATIKPTTGRVLIRA